MIPHPPSILQRRVIRPLLAVPLLALSLAACEENPVECVPPPNVSLAADEVGRAMIPVALRVTVVDSVSGENLAEGASGMFVTGTFADSLRHDIPTLLMAYGGAGRYSVVVQHPGYATWGDDEVIVRAGECTTETADITARLQPLGG